MCSLVHRTYYANDPVNHFHSSCCTREHGNFVYRVSFRVIIARMLERGTIKPLECDFLILCGTVLNRTNRFGAFRRIAAFTLVEVVVALSIFSFALVAIVGLFMVGLNTSKESSDQIQEANFASLLISTRRALPTNVIANFALPPLNVLYSSAGTYLTNSAGVASDGTTNATTPVYNLFYQAGTNSLTGSHLALVHFIVWTPISAPFPASNPSARYELTTQVALP
jgi:uncharacterized protein (TIGR02598 family)